MHYRRATKTLTGVPAVDGAGVRLVRVIGAKDTRDFDPFLMLDAFDSENPDDYVKGFPWHPHRGIETVTFLIRGEIAHGDSLGNEGTIRDGGCQWMTAGSGIVHREMPLPSPRMLGLQLWVNLPAKDKMTAPKYRDLPKEKIPVVAEGGARVSVIAGSYGETAGAARGGHVDATLLSIALEPGSSCEIPVGEGDTAFVYIIEGALSFGPTESSAGEGDRDAEGEIGRVGRRTAVLLEGGSRVRLAACGDSGATCVFFSGRPLHEPIAWGGPIVMNTREELERAFRELDEGTFIREPQK